MRQIFRAPLFVPIKEINEEERVLGIYLRDHANRGDTEGIKRKFYLKFASMVELSSFQYAHNQMIKAHELRKREVKTNTAEAPSKKRKVEAISSPSGKLLREEAAKKSKKVVVGEDVETQFESKLESFKEGDGVHDCFDDDFECTQDPLGFDDSF